MRKTLVTVALAGTLALTGGALLAPGTAFAQAGPAGERITALRDALRGLVSAGTLTQSQADQVASTLAELPARGRHGGGHGGRHGGGRGGPERLTAQDTAEALGITVEQLREQRRAGRTLAQIAQAAGIDKAELIADLVTAAKARLAEAVAADRLTQARADELAGGLQARITDQVDTVRPGKGHGHDGGPRHRGEGGEGDDSGGESGGGDDSGGDRSPSPGPAQSPDVAPGSS